MNAFADLIPKQKKPVSGVVDTSDEYTLFGLLPKGRGIPEDSFVGDLARGAKKRAAGLAQLGADTFGASEGIREDLAALAEQYQREGEGTGARGAIGEIVGDPMTALAIAVPAAKTYKAAALLGGGFGVAEGATSPLLQGESRGEKMVIGGTAGAVLGPLAKYVVDKSPAIMRLLKKTSANPAASANEAGALSRAEQKILKRLRQDFPDDNQLLQALEAMKKSPDSLAVSAGKETVSLGRGAAQYKGGRAVAQENFEAMLRTAHPRLEATLKATISPQYSVLDATEALAKASAKRTGPLYRRAYDANLKMMTPQIKAMLNLPEGKRGLTEAARLIRLDAIKNPDAQKILPLMDDYMAGKSDDLPLHALDYVQRSLRDLTKTPELNEARIYKNLHKAFVAELDAADATGVYAQARRAAADKFRIQEAIEAGEDFFSTRGKNALTDEDLSRFFKAMTPEEQQGYKIGLMKQTLARVRSAPVGPDGAGANPTRFMHSPAIQNRLQSVLGDAFPEFSKSVDDIGRIYRVRNEVLAGSITSPNQMARREFADAVPDDLLQDIIQQRPVDVLINQVARRLNKSRYGLSNKSARQVATMLFESDPAKKALYVERLMGAAKKGSKGINPETVASRKLQAYFDFDDALASRMGRATKLTAPGVIYEQRNTGNNDGSGTGSGTERPSGMVPSNDNVNPFFDLVPQRNDNVNPFSGSLKP